MPNYGETIYGGKYEATKSLTTTQIAALIRQDVKDAIAQGKLPKGLKVSVRTRYFAGGSAIDLEVTAVPAGFKLLSEEYLDEQGFPTTRSEEAKAMVKVLEGIHFAYNYDGSDMSVDYFSVHYYGRVSLSDLEYRERMAAQQVAA